MVGAEVGVEQRRNPSAQPLVVTWYLDINTEPGCSRATDPHMTLDCSLSWTSVWLQLAAWTTEIRMAPVAA